MSNLILPTVSNLPASSAGDAVSVFMLATVAVVYMGAFAPILWRQFKAGRTA